MSTAVPTSERGPVSWPAEGESRVPYRVFLDPEIYDREQETIYRGRTWCFLGLEAEVPKPGDFKTTFIGDTPVALTRDADGALRAFVNRCAHRGAIVCRELTGNKTVHTCVYHQWAYDPAGNLVGVPFRRGMAGKGGYPADFRPEDHGLRKLRVEAIRGMVFATFDPKTEPLLEYLGAAMIANIERIFCRPIRVLGTTRQLMFGNWKLYAENTRDSYHGGLLHLFYPTFGIYRPMQESSTVMDDRRWHNVFTVAAPCGKESLDAYKSAAGMRAVDETAKLEDPSVVEFKKDIGDNVSLSIQSIFPS
ncbi:MAG: Rieske 2Fe-2S domain-containing protein, partial [Candidatus Binatia bacterium]